MDGRLRDRVMKWWRSIDRWPSRPRGFRIMPLQLHRRQGCQGRMPTRPPSMGFIQIKRWRSTTSERFFARWRWASRVSISRPPLSPRTRPHRGTRRRQIPSPTIHLGRSRRRTAPRMMTRLRRTTLRWRWALMMRPGPRTSDHRRRTMPRRIRRGMYILRSRCSGDLTPSRLNLLQQLQPLFDHSVPRIQIRGAGIGVDGVPDLIITALV